MKIEVNPNRFDKSLRLFKKKVEEEGILKEVRRREHYVKPCTDRKIKKAAAVLGHNEVSISPSNGGISLSVIDSKDSTSNAFSIDVEGDYPEGVDFNFVLNVNNVKVVNEDFAVNISSKLISRWKSQQSAIEYFIALEKSSNYGV